MPDENPFSFVQECFSKLPPKCPNNWAAFEINLVAKIFKKSPNLVSLLARKILYFIYVRENRRRVEGMAIQLKSTYTVSGYVLMLWCDQWEILF